MHSDIQNFRSRGVGRGDGGAGGERAAVPARPGVGRARAAARPGEERGRAAPDLRPAAAARRRAGVELRRRRQPHHVAAVAARGGHGHPQLAARRGRPDRPPHRHHPRRQGDRPARRKGADDHPAPRTRPRIARDRRRPDRDDGGQGAAGRRHPARHPFGHAQRPGAQGQHAVDRLAPARPDAGRLRPHPRAVAGDVGHQMEGARQGQRRQGRQGRRLPRAERRDADAQAARPAGRCPGALPRPAAGRAVDLQGLGGRVEDDGAAVRAGRLRAGLAARGGSGADQGGDERSARPDRAGARIGAGQCPLSVQRPRPRQLRPADAREDVDDPLGRLQGEDAAAAVAAEGARHHRRAGARQHALR